MIAVLGTKSAASNLEALICSHPRQPRLRCMNFERPKSCWSSCELMQQCWANDIQDAVHHTVTLFVPARLHVGCTASLARRPIGLILCATACGLLRLIFVNPLVLGQAIAAAADNLVLSHVWVAPDRSLPCVGDMVHGAVQSGNSLRMKSLS